MRMNGEIHNVGIEGHRIVCSLLRLVGKEQMEF